MIANIKQNNNVSNNWKLFYTFRQGNFKVNTGNCRFASPLVWYYNNIVKLPVDMDYARELERRAYEEFIMPKRWLTLLWWLNRLSKLMGRKYKMFNFGDRMFHRHLRKGDVISVVITTTEWFVQQWRARGIINDTMNTKIRGWHVIGLAMRWWKYYLVNTRGERDYREMSKLDLDCIRQHERCGLLI